MTRYEIIEEDIRHNINVIKQKAKVPVWGVVKFDGYGVGVLTLANILKSEGITKFATTEMADAILLRESGFSDEQILLIGVPNTDEDIKTAIQNGFIIPVGSPEYLKKVEDMSIAVEKKAICQVKVDTGMGRLGFLPNQTEQIAEVYKSDKIEVVGIYTHLHDAHRISDTSKKQMDMFTKVISELEAMDIDCKEKHIAESAGVFLFDGMQMDSVRIGSAFMGRILGSNPQLTNLKRVGTLCTEICSVKDMPKGHNLGYGVKHKLKKNAKVAVIPVGIWHGMKTLSIRERLLRKKMYLTVNGKRVECLGTVGEGHTFLDVTGIEAHIGDEVRIDINPLKVNASLKKELV